ncbi:ArgS-related anticodon-binding protein NrtL [Streptomyces sp. I05A-00742]|uniref:ArgS-related anticodon-binding protein NrtL n=1 Tax=Streptomyces sp. I05A-00742 TaxID=2732853 RepID=UPI00148869DA|nr:arginine--tRNA ligase [Streptomyces sp. I05A-00742]
MTPADLSRAVLRTVRRAVEADELCAVVPATVGVRVPPHPGCGDYATNVALRLAKESGRPARDVAEVLRRRLVREPGIARVEIAGPGFLNITLQGHSRARLVRDVLGRPADREPLPVHPPAALVRRLGSDAARWSLLSPPGLDRDLLLVQRDGNPLFRVRYAHSRCLSLIRNARDLGFGPDVDDSVDDFGDGSAPLLAALADHPRIVAVRDPERLARALERLADAFLRWQTSCTTLPRGDEKPSVVHRARLALAEATGKVLADGLHQLGITAPARL